MFFFKEIYCATLAMHFPGKVSATDDEWVEVTLITGECQNDITKLTF